MSKDEFSVEPDPKAKLDFRGISGFFGRAAVNVAAAFTAKPIIQPDTDPLSPQNGTQGSLSAIGNGIASGVTTAVTATSNFVAQPAAFTPGEGTDPLAPKRVTTQEVKDFLTQPTPEKNKEGLRNPNKFSP